jgi:hypothetical protein
MPPKQNLVGRVFGRWTVLREAGRYQPPGGGRGGHVLWLCRCSCPAATERVELSVTLLSGHSLSCGCYQQLRASQSTRRHGGSANRRGWYSAWQHMWARCTQPTNQMYADYGGRGIYVCDRWRDSAAFYADMGERPSKRHSIDRRDNDGPYSPENCRWALPSEQSRNTRRNRWVTYHGTTLCLIDWYRVFKHSSKHHPCAAEFADTDYAARFDTWLAGRDLQQLIIAAGVTPKEQEH